jgi:hypothetical protein
MTRQEFRVSPGRADAWRAPPGKTASRVAARCAPLLAALLAAPTVHAQTYSGTLSIVTERVSRGISMSGDRPSAMLDLGYRDDRNWALGLGLATVHGQGDATAEAIVSATRWWQIDDNRTLTVSAAHYDYAGGGNASRLRYADLSVGGLWDSPTGQWAASVSLSPDLPVTTGDGYQGHLGGTILELTWHRRLMGAVAADVGWGVVDNWGRKTSSYTFANGGLSYTAGAWRFSLVRLYSAVPPDAKGARPRWIAGMAWTFK